MVEALQSVAIKVLLKVFLTSDHITPATGKTVAVTISKNGGAFGNPSAGATNATEISNGWYYVDLSTTDTATLGPLAVRATATACDDCEPPPYQVVSATNGGLSNLDATVSSRSSQTSVDDLPTNAELATALAAADDAVLTAISNLNNLSALANLYGAPLLEIPDSSSTDFAFTLVVRDNEGKLVALDGSPTITAANAAGTSRSANLSAVSNPSTGRYTFTYNVESTDTEESLRITCSGTVSAEARYIEWIGAVVNYDTLTTLNAIKAKTDNLPSDPADQSAVEAAITAATSPLATSAALTTLSAIFSGITSLAQWLGLMAGKQTGNSTARTELRATGAGSGTYDETTDSLEKIGEQVADTYTAQVAFIRDVPNTRDEYYVTWRRNGIILTSGITSPTIQIVKRSDGSNLVASTAMTQVASTGSYYYNATAVTTPGELYRAVVAATIDGSTRTYGCLIGRDDS